MVTTTNVLAPSQIQPGMKLRNSKGGNQPPKNSSTAKMATSHILAYSARKNMAKAMPEYSTMCPATISDSPSTTSNGCRLVSASPEMKYTTKIGSRGNQFQDRKVKPLPAAMPVPWLMTMSVMFRLPETISTTTRQKPIAIS